jgi:hypothetical protein
VAAFGEPSAVPVVAFDDDGVVDVHQAFDGLGHPPVDPVAALDGLRDPVAKFEAGSAARLAAGGGGT